MAEEKKIKSVEQLQEDQLDEVNGGVTNIRLTVPRG